MDMEKIELMMTIYTEQPAPKSGQDCIFEMNLGTERVNFDVTTN